MNLFRNCNLHVIRVLAGGVWLLPALTLSAAEPVDYERDVWPILQTHCLACHTADEQQGGFVIETPTDMLRGGDSGPALTPGVADSSRMLLMATGKLEPKMPPDGAGELTEDELAMLASWIEQGATGPEGTPQPRRELRVPTIARLTDRALPITALAGRADALAIGRFGEVELTGSEGTAIGKLPPQPGKIHSLRFSADGRRLLVASGVTGLYGRAAIYDLATSELLSEMIGHQDDVQVAIYSPDERLVATAGYDHKIILWDAASGTPIRRLDGHNGAVFTLAFSPDGQVLVSGSADETVKVWQVETGRRLDTMSQPTAEVLTVAVTPDGQQVLAGSADSRLRVWRLVSKTDERTNPIIAARFLDESPLTQVALTPDGSAVIVVARSGNVKLLSTVDWTPLATLPPLDAAATDLAISHDGSQVTISLLDGNLVRRDLRSAEIERERPSHVERPVADIFLDTGTTSVLEESALRQSQPLSAAIGAEGALQLPRGAEVTGTIAEPAEEDWFAFQAGAGELWVIETDTSGLNSRLDSVIEVRDASAAPILRTRLQAVRDSYFTFRGKDSRQTSDFRLFAWEEMKLGEYLYASGEVTRLWLYPRGADSGFDVFPGMGNRWTYFGTTGTVHTLGEPAYIVRPLDEGEEPLTNGLPVFDVPFLNDDEPTQTRGRDSYLRFQAPDDGRYLIRLRDVRGEGGEEYRYRLRLRPAVPSFIPKLNPIHAELRRGSGREFLVRADRVDEFDGEITFEIAGLPPGLQSNFPVTVQPGQHFAVGNIWAAEDAVTWDGEVKPMITAQATINGRRVERQAGELGPLRLADRGKITLAIYPDAEEAVAFDADSVVTIRRGQTISLRVRADRETGFENEVSLGNETSGRNLPHGVYVDNIGLNGLLIRQNESERQFFITADQIAELGKRQFFLTGNVDGGLTSQPITLEVAP